jgi:hypothetical protein
VIEQIEGIDLRQRARDGAGVTEIAPGVFETVRAQQAGRAAAAEVYEMMDTQLPHGFRRLAQALRALFAGRATRTPGQHPR